MHYHPDMSLPNIRDPVLLVPVTIFHDNEEQIMLTSAQFVLQPHDLGIANLDSFLKLLIHILHKSFHLYIERAKICKNIGSVIYALCAHSPSLRALKFGSFLHALDAFKISNSTQYLKYEKGFFSKFLELQVLVDLLYYLIFYYVCKK